MDSHQSLISLMSIELRIIRARNMYLKSSKDLFVRCYLPAGSNNKRVRIDSQQISSNSNLIWNQKLSLDCLGDEETIKSLKQGTIVFELRSRSCTPLVAKLSGSKLVGRAEMAWNDLVERPDMEIEKWAVMIPTNRYVYSDDVKPPALQIAIKVKEPIIERKKVCERRWDNCGCIDRGCESCVAYEFFALEAVLDALY